MKIPPAERRMLLPLAAVMAALLISRLLYDLAGVQFDGETYAGYWQFIDPKLLTTDLWRSVFHLHTQPPLMNLVTGLVLQAFPGQHGSVFHVLYLLLGASLAAAMYLLATALRLPAWLSAGVTILFIVSPAAVLYEHWLFYAYAVTAALTLAAVSLHRFITRRTIGWGLAFFSLLASMALTWSLYHLLWLLVSVGLCLLALPDRRKTALAALIPTLIVTTWYAKNLVLAGAFTANSWAGMNLSRVSTFCLPADERLRLVRRGMLSEFARYPPFRNSERYLNLLPHTPTTGIPLLDTIYTSTGERNRHHLVYVEASRYYLRDALRVISLRPSTYASCATLAFFVYFHSATDYERVLDNRGRIDGLDLWWNRLAYGQPQRDVTGLDQYPDLSASHIAWWIVISFLTAVIGGGVTLWKERRRYSEPEYVLVAFMWFNVLYVSLAGNLADLGENNRFRFTVDPFILLLFVFYTRAAWGRRGAIPGGGQRDGELPAKAE